MDKKIFIGLSVIISLAVIVMFILIALPPKEEKQEVVPQATACIDGDVSEYADLALQQNNLELCSGLCGADKQDICYHIIARKSSDPTICNRIRDDVKQGACIFSLFYMSGNKSADICKMIRNASTQGWCLRLLAGERGDEAICREIEDQQERRFCLENVKKGPIAIRGDGIMEEIEFDCSAIFPDCDAGWLDENLSEPENTQKISAYCKDRCLEIFRRAGGYGTITGSSNITCGCS